MTDLAHDLATSGFAVVRGFWPRSTTRGLRRGPRRRWGRLDLGALRGAGRAFTTREQDRARTRTSSSRGPGAALLRGGRGDGAVNKLGHALHELEFGFRTHSKVSPGVSAVLRELGFRSPVAVQSMLIVKGAGVGGEVGAHQDGTFLATCLRQLSARRAVEDDEVALARLADGRRGEPAPGRRAQTRSELAVVAAEEEAFHPPLCEPGTHVQAALSTCVSRGPPEPHHVWGLRHRNVPSWCAPTSPPTPAPLTMSMLCTATGDRNPSSRSTALTPGLTLLWVRNPNSSSCSACPSLFDRPVPPPSSKKGRTRSPDSRKYASAARSCFPRREGAPRPPQRPRSSRAQRRLGPRPQPPRRGPRPEARTTANPDVARSWARSVMAVFLWGGGSGGGWGWGGAWVRGRGTMRGCWTRGLGLGWSLEGDEVGGEAARVLRT